MTKETLEHANKVLKELRSERDHLEYLTNIVEMTGEASNRALFEISASIVSTHYRRNTFISPEVAEMALNKEIENTTKHIADLETELDGLH